MRILARPGYPLEYIHVEKSISLFDINLGIYSNMLLQPILEEVVDGSIYLPIFTSPFYWNVRVA